MGGAGRKLIFVEHYAQEILPALAQLTYDNSERKVFFYSKSGEIIAVLPLLPSLGLAGKALCS